MSILISFACTQCIYNVGENQIVQTQADMQYEAVDSHKQQNIQLQSNAAYASLGGVM